MAITEILEESEMIDTGAPSIKYEGERPLKKQEMLMAGPDWYIKRMEILMDEYGYDYDEAGEIAYDSDKYYEVIGIDPGGIGDESRNMDEEVVEEEGIMRAANGGITPQLVRKNQDGSRPGYRGDAAYRSESEQSKSIGQTGSGKAPSTKDERGDGPPSNPWANAWDGGDVQDGPPKKTPPKDDKGPEQKKRDHPEQEAKFAASIAADAKRVADRKKRQRDLKFLEDTGKLGYTRRTKDANLQNLDLLSDHPRREGLSALSGLAAVSDAFYVSPETAMFDIDSMREIYNPMSVMAGTKGITKNQTERLQDLREDMEIEQKIMDGTLAPGEWIEYRDRNPKPKPPDNEPSDPCKGPNPPAYCFVGGKNQKDEEVEEEEWYMPLAFRAEGGRVGRAFGGIMGDDGRRAYGLGSIFKKIKKVFKSPLAKAALMGLGAYQMGLIGGGKNFKLTEMIMGKGGKGGLWNWAKDNPFGAIAGASALSGLMANRNYKKYDDWGDADDGTGLGDLDQYRNYYQSPRAFRAEGGDAESGLMDLGGMEKDYREEGGFVPIGGKEKADDVPARLSKNEFVFTADAVRGAGDGDIDKGAEVMYNMMKNLEAGGQVSEESQGLDGAKEMFQTSQRLEEVL